jgi:thioredoxin reductase (NADPH)
MTSSEVREAIADGSLDALVVEDMQTGERTRIEARALFVFIGAEPHTGWLHGRVALDDGGYVLTGQDAAAALDAHPHANGARRTPLFLETSLRGVFAAGDVRSGSTQRIAAAVGDGAIVIRHVHQLLSGRLNAVRLAQSYVAVR